MVTNQQPAYRERLDDVLQIGADVLEDGLPRILTPGLSTPPKKPAAAERTKNMFHPILEIPDDQVRGI